MPNISMIAAIGQHNELGKNNDLIWRISADLKRFKLLTTGHTIVMGRKTYESLKNGALPNRRNIVLSRDNDYKAPGAEVFTTIEQVLDAVSIDEHIYIVGGSSIYARFLDLSTTLYITKVEATTTADVFFPEIDPLHWKEEEISPIMEDEKSGLKFSYFNYRRIE